MPDDPIDPLVDSSVPPPDAMLQPMCDPTVIPLNRVYGFDPEVGDHLGVSVALTDQWLAFGVPEHSGEGWIYAFARAGSMWDMDNEHHFTAEDVVPDQRFAGDVALSGQIMAIGNPHDRRGTGTELGSIHMRTFDGNFWIDVDRLSGDPPGSGNPPRFGSSVAIAGDVVAASEPGNDRVQLFVRDGLRWPRRQSLDVPALIDGVIAMTDELPVIGAPTDSAMGPNAGAVHVYRRSGELWEPDGVLRPPVAGAAFGHSVAVRGDIIAVGAPSEDTGAPDAGAAYMFQRSENEWVLLDTLAATAPAPGQRFGSAVALSRGSTAIIGAEGQGATSGQGRHDGAAYLFVFNGVRWSMAMELQCAGSMFGQCGASIAATDNQFVITAPTADTSGEPMYDPDQGDVFDAGMAYPFDLLCGP